MARMELALVQLRLAPRARHSQDRQRPKRVELAANERGLEVLSGVVHRLFDGAGAQHLPEGVDGPVVIHDSTVRIFLPDLLEVAAAHLVCRSACNVDPLRRGSRGLPALVLERVVGG